MHGTLRETGTFTVPLQQLQFGYVIVAYSLHSPFLQEFIQLFLRVWADACAVLGRLSKLLSRDTRVCVGL